MFPDSAKFADGDFLRWEYEASPSGPAIITEDRDDSGLVAHYAVLPQRWIVRGHAETWALSLNTAVSERGRGRGLFTTLAERTYETAATGGVSAIVGVANANSTPGFAGRLRFDVPGPLPTRVVLPRPVRAIRGVERVSVDDVSDLLDLPGATEDVRRVWDVAELRWRLADPTQAFTILRGPEGAVITCRATQGRLPVTVLAKFLTGQPGEAIDPAPLVGAACRLHKTPIALHAGHQSGVRLRGVPVPARLRPSPLNLIMRRLDEMSVAAPTVFEFLDFDAY